MGGAAWEISGEVQATGGRPWPHRLERRHLEARALATLGGSPPPPTPCKSAAFWAQRRLTEEGEQQVRAPGAPIADGCRRQERPEQREEGGGQARQRLRAGGHARQGERGRVRLRPARGEPFRARRGGPSRRARRLPAAVGAHVDIGNAIHPVGKDRGRKRGDAYSVFVLALIRRVTHAQLEGAPRPPLLVQGRCVHADYATDRSSEDGSSARDAGGLSRLFVAGKNGWWQAYIRYARVCYLLQYVVSSPPPDYSDLPTVGPRQERMLGEALRTRTHDELYIYGCAHTHHRLFCRISSITRAARAAICRQVTRSPLGEPKPRASTWCASAMAAAPKRDAALAAMRHRTLLVAANHLQVSDRKKS